MSSGITNRYLGMAKGAVVATGNTFGLDKAQYYDASNDPFNPGNLGSAGVFLTLSNTATYPSNWSTIYNNNQLPSPIGIIKASQVSSTLKIGSTAKLYIPRTAKKILHAELIWYANINSSAGVNPDTTIIFSHPDPQDPGSIVSQSISLSQFKVRYDLSSTEISESWRIYVRSADVTEAISIGEYSYSVSGISASIRGGTDQSNAAGWCLLVAYADDTMEYNNLSIYVMCTPVQSSSGLVEISIPKIITPSTDPLKGKAVIAAAEGDIVYTGDYVTFGPTTNPTTRLAIGNHSSDNFFIGEVSIADNDTDIGGTTVMGSQDTRGSMGLNNHNASNDINGARHGLDLTRVDISNTLIKNQTNAYMNFKSTGDVYIPIAFGCQIKVNTLIKKEVDLTFADIDDIITYTTTVNNGGSSINWSNVWFQDSIPFGTEFVTGSVEVFYNNVKQTGFDSANPQIGFALKNTISKSDTVVVKFKIKVKDFSLIQNATIINESHISYKIKDSSCIEYTVNETSNQVETKIQHAQLYIYKSNIPDTPVTCTNIIQYKIEIQNTGSVQADVVINGFYDKAPLGTRFVGDVTSFSNVSGYDNTSIQYNTDRSAIVNVKKLMIRPSEMIVISANVILTRNVQNG